MANPCYLVVHPKGMLIWDCGFEDSLADLPAGYNSGRSIWSLPKKLAQQLSEMGVDPKDIDYFTLSHSHLDHSGNANLFKSSTWIVDDARSAERSVGTECVSTCRSRGSTYNEKKKIITIYQTNNT